MIKHDVKALERIQKARSMLIMQHVFFGSIALRLKLVEAPVGTMATDGVHIFYDKKFVKEHQLQVLVGVVAHEVYHCIYKHHVRFGDRNPELWNVAGDYRINYDLIKAGFKLPDFVLYDEKYAKMTTEEIYSALERDAAKQEQSEQGKPCDDMQGQGNGQGQGKPAEGQQGQKAGNGHDDSQNGAGKPDRAGKGRFEGYSDPGGMGGVVPFKEHGDGTSTAEQAAHWDQVVREAAMIAKAHNAGNVPGFLERVIAEVLTPKVDWKSELRRFTADATQMDYDWCAPDRRFLHGGTILPGLTPDSLSKLVVLLDTSGSITNKLLSEYSAEVTALLDENVVDKVVVLYVDTQVQAVQEFERGDVVKLKPKGGGGTKFASAMRYIADHHEDAKVLIGFTDLLVREFGNEPEMPVIWAVHGTQAHYNAVSMRPPFGECLHVA